MIVIVCYKCSFCITSRSMMTRLCPALSHFILYEIAAFKMCHDPNDFIFQSEKTQMQNENDCFSFEKVHTTNFSAPTQGILINKSFLEGKSTVLVKFLINKLVSSEKKEPLIRFASRQVCRGIFLTSY